uniref:Uncharacterized protein n=1 Tax=Cacopsylla melanoneura TaxID=428564 RepID=A0A8D9AHZ0_9HEMI
MLLWSGFLDILHFGLSKKSPNSSEITLHILDWTPPQKKSWLRPCTYRVSQKSRSPQITRPLFNVIDKGTLNHLFFVSNVARFIFMLKAVPSFLFCFLFFQFFLSFICYIRIFYFCVKCFQYLFSFV